MYLLCTRREFMPTLSTLDSSLAWLLARLMGAWLLARLMDAPSGVSSRQVGLDPATTGSVTGVEADVFLAAYYAAEVAAKTIKAGNTNTQVCG